MGRAAQATSANGAAIGANSLASAANATATGAYSNASGDSATASGFHAGAAGGDSAAYGAYSNASGQSSAAYGVGSNASAMGATALGYGTIANGASATAVGQNSLATGENATALGQAGAASARGATAVGQGSVASAEYATAIGQGSQATIANSVALGAGSIATAAAATYGGFVGGRYYAYAGGASAGGALSVGSAGRERQIQNVAAGRVSATSTDAVNGSQLYAAQQTVLANDQAVAQLGQSVNALHSSVIMLGGQIASVQREARAGIAAVMATPQASMPSAPGRTSVAFSTALYKNQQAIGVSAAHRLDANAPTAVMGAVGWASGTTSITGRVSLAVEF